MFLGGYFAGGRFGKSPFPSLFIYLPASECFVLYDNKSWVQGRDGKRQWNKLTAVRYLLMEQISKSSLSKLVVNDVWFS